ncbi:hypothetical protein HU200_064410 [Digitaria exilis]|uniref:Uncharacterized protein n=1 Tax=Digitaria exilis TaxID=1010633 RepID=A0A835A3I4_9POAL|nr:hypothetical protein HU200_064410 [Digitaria exilis]
MEPSKVQVIESSFVAPSEAAPTKELWLSPFDLMMANRGHTPVVFFYCSGAAFSDAARIKEGMAKALAAFYPLAGRLGVDGDGRTQISCNGEGALFIVAHSNLKSDDLYFTKPSPELRGMFVPRVEPASLILAVTSMKCGGVVLGMTFHHAVGDAPSMFHFMQTWSAFTRDGEGAAAVELPCHDRTLLRARSPPVVVDLATLSVLCPRVTFTETPGRPAATEVFTISRDQLIALRRLCGGASTFCSVSALVWQCTSVARRLQPDAEARLNFPANVRRRMASQLVPDCYFSNALVFLGAAAAAGDIASEALASVAGRIGGAIARMDAELVRSAIDYSEVAGVDGRPMRGSMPETELRITSWLGMPARLTRAESVRGGVVYLIDDGPRDLQRGAGAAGNIKEFGRLFYANIAEASKKLALDN